MHELAFGLKRAHLCAVAEGKWRLKKCELTPARFDALMVILRAGGKCLQREIWQRLGLTRSTICKMLDAMEAKGLVWRMRSDVDGRQVVVVLTRGGLNRMVVAIDEVILGDSVRCRWDRMHKDGRAFVLRAIDTVRTITRGLYDTSDHHYRTDDLDEKDDAKAYLFVAEVRSEIERLAYLRDQARSTEPTEPPHLPRPKEPTDLPRPTEPTHPPRPKEPTEPTELPHLPRPTEPPEHDPLTEPPPSTRDLYDDERSLADLFWWKEDEEPWTDEDIDDLLYDRDGITDCLERWAHGAAEASGANDRPD